MHIHELIAQLSQQLIACNQRIATAESCTGGLIAKLCTDLPGSSVWFDHGIVSYSNQAKHRLLGVSEDTLKIHGAVSKATAIAMASGLLARAEVGHTVAVTGIAGPDGGSTEKPVGTVWIAWASATGAHAECFLFNGDRQSVREQTAYAAIAGLYQQLSPNKAVSAS